jgi:DNA-binding beta-propeller fold protein YncE
LKRKTVYSLMGVIVTLVTVLFVAIYFLNLQNQIDKVAKPLVDRDGPPVFSHLIYGDFDESLNKPMDVAKISEYIFVTDTNNKRVQVFDLGGTAIFKFGKEGKGDGEFMFPYGITGDKEGNVYVADLYNAKISIHDKKGNFISNFKEKDQKVKSIKAPGAIRIYNEQLYVPDIEQGKVFVFNLQGEKLLEIGQMGTKEGEFRAPNAVTVDKEGNIYVCDTGNQRVQVFDKEGKYLRSINGSENNTGSSVLVNPRGIAIDARGFLYVVNNLTHYVYGFDTEGKKVFEFGGMGDQNEQFYLPNGLFVDENDQVYITDTLNQRIGVYY